MKYLVVIAHPDDEVLGAGGSIYKLVQHGNTVEVCILSSKAAARMFRRSDDELESDMLNSFERIGISKAYKENFPNIKFNNVNHLELVQFIEKTIIESKPDIVITHHPADVNNDHLHTSMACQAAVRLFQRQPKYKPINELWYMEVPSSTEWCLNTGMSKFEPNLFIEIGEDGVEKKIEALSDYDGVMRDFPHPRSREALTGLAAHRGAQSGCNYAEAFQLAFRRVTF